jgi:hypothetical protein
MLSKGRGKLSITQLVLKILKKGRELKYNVQPIWVSRENPLLQKADCLSKGIDSDNWEISVDDFVHLGDMFGTFTIDLFATSGNTKCSRLYSRSHEEGTLGVESFAQNWADKCAFAAPPVSLVMRTIRKAAVAKMNGILLVPLWKGAKFWTFAFNNGFHLNSIFAEMHVVRMTMFAWEISRKDRIGGKELQFLVLVLRRERAGASDLKSLPGKGRCFRIVFNKTCGLCM